MSSISISPKRRRDGTKSKFKVMGNHTEFLSRIKKTLYYGKLPITERFSLPVTELAAELFSEVKNGRSLERLDLEEAAAMSRNACVSPCSLVLALLYLERLKTCNPEYLQRVAPSELFLVSMMVASKFLHDDGEADEVFNDEWASSAGLSVREINRIERDFLQAIQWEVFVSEQSFWTRLSRMEGDVALKEGRRRGWFSYTDLENLLDTVDLTALAQAVITVSAVCLTSYTASVLTLIGSAFIVSQIPGIPMSTSVSSSTCDVPKTHIQESAMTSPEQNFSGTPPSVSVLTTSLILASLSSCPSENSTQSPICRCDCSKEITCSCQNYLANTSDNMIYGHNSVLSELISEWAKHISWEWWKMKFEQLLSNLSPVNSTENQRLTDGKRKYKSDDSSKRAGLGSHFRQTDDGNNIQDENEHWIAEIRNWLDQTALERSSQTKFFPLEITSNY